MTETVRIPLVMTVLICFSALGSCRHRPDTPQTVVTAETEEPRRPFDPQEFLHRFTGGPSGEDRVGGPLSGRRYTAAERAAARGTISDALRGIGYSPLERPYEWGGAVNREYISPGYMESGYGDRGVNLVAVLPATVPSDSWIVVGAHYDTVDTSPGADDNASGVTAVLLVAEWLIGIAERDRNVMFVFFDQEEIGLVGSYLFTLRLAEERIESVDAHIIDMVGWDGDGDRAVELTFCTRHGDSEDEAVEDYFMELYAQAESRLEGTTGISVGDVSLRRSCRSDHVPFGWYGYRAVHIAEEFSGNDMCPNYHHPQDTCETLDYGYIRAVAALVAAAVTVQLM